MTTLKTKTQLHENLQNLWNRDLRPVKQHRGRIKKGCVHFAQDFAGFFLWLFTTYRRIGQWTQADWRKLNSRKVRWLSPQLLKQAKWENVPAEVSRKFSKKQHCALAKDKVFASHPALVSLLHFADAIQHFDTLPDLTPFTAGQKQALTELFKPKPDDTPKPHIPDDGKPKCPKPNICDPLPHAPDKGNPNKPGLNAAGQRMDGYRLGKKTLTPADIRLNIKQIEDPRPTINPNKIDSFEHLFKYVTQSTTINLNHLLAPRVIHDFLKGCSKAQTEGVLEWLKKHPPIPLSVIVQAMDAVKDNGMFQDLHPAIPLLLQLYIDSKVKTAQHDPLFGVLLAIEIEKKRNDNTTAAHTLWLTQRKSFSFEQCCQLLESFMTKELENPGRNIVYHARDHLLTVFQAKKWSSKLAHSSPTFICWLHTKQIPIPKEILDPALALYRGEREKL
ncbi:MAG: hypothetical protein KDK65_04425, partial [Chlamydiia bacterium]|nr:hypothetical protein [Chlamydiia bacterium]